MTKQEDSDALLKLSARSLVENEGISIPDIPETCLEGRLGEMCAERMSDFPRAWAWPALLAAASVRVPHTSSVRSNVYVALVGPIGGGKSSVINAANYILNVGDELFDDYVGSAEGLAKHLPSEFGGLYRLWYVDELGHMLDKARIEGASFVRVLNTAFYKDEQTLIVAKGAKHKFNCKLSIIGGVVDDDFEDAFGAITAHGMYDRFLFGYAPTGYKYNYHPLEDYGEPLDDFHRNIKPVERINPDVWAYKKEWSANNPTLNREFELAMRCAVICATFDGRSEISKADLGPALVYAEMQGKVRTLLRPNRGRNQGGEVTQKITDYLLTHAPSGEWMRLRDLMRTTHVERYGMDTVNRVLNGMNSCGDIELSLDKSSAQKPRIIRMVV